MRYKFKLSHLSFVTFLIDLVAGHGRLIEPPSRVTMWRLGYDTPANYNDNQMFCGGFATQYNLNNGKCGVCGDNWSGERESEPGGKYATGTMVRLYQPGQIIKTKVEITANHKGFFEFRLCKNDIVKAKVQQTCFDKNVLANKTGATKLYINNNPGMFEHELQLPSGLRCRYCVLQWRYHTANSWGVDPVTGQGCIGCGNQEEFYGCADVVIGHEEIPLGVAAGPQHMPQPAGPGDGHNNWDATNSGQTDNNNNNNNKTACNCPCVSGSAIVTSPLHKFCWVICFTVAWIFLNI